MKYKFCSKNLEFCCFLEHFPAYLEHFRTYLEHTIYSLLPYSRITELNLSEVRYYHLNKAPQKLQTVEYYYDSADDIDNAEKLVGDFSAE